MSMVSLLNATGPRGYNDGVDEGIRFSTSGKTPVLIIMDDFYSNPIELREWILEQDFNRKGNYPGQRTESYANQEIKELIEKYIYPFAGNITFFDMDKNNPNNDNGSFQYTLCSDRSWIHTDGRGIDWAGIIYLTPDAPLSSGTGLYQFEDGTRWEPQSEEKNNEYALYGQDSTKWKLVDRIGNIFNRLILFNARHYHMSLDYFGNDIETGRLFQTFFFSTEESNLK